MQSAFGFGKKVFQIEEKGLSAMLSHFGACSDLLKRAQLSPLNKTEEGPAWPGLLDQVLPQKPKSKL